MTLLIDDIQSAINRHSAENVSNTPDYVLAQFLVKALAAFDHATNTRALHMTPTIPAPSEPGQSPMPPCAGCPEAAAATTATGPTRMLEAAPVPSAPRVTPDDVVAAIASEHYFTAQQGVIGYEREVLLCGQEPDPTNPEHWAGNLMPASLGLLTFCVLILRNGTKVVGINYGAIDPAQHDAERGRMDARADAIRQVWPLLGYALRERLAAEQHQREWQQGA